MNRSKLAVGTIVGVALLLAGFSVWYHFQQGRRALNLWGPTAGNTIRHAPHVELLILGSESTTEGGGSDSAADRTIPLPIVRRIDITAQPGLVHARHALIMDSSFEWDDTPMTSPPPWQSAHWQSALVFTGPDSEAILLFDLDQRLVRLLTKKSADALAATDHTGRLTPPAAHAIATFQSRTAPK